MLQRICLAPAALCDCEIKKTPVFSDEHIESFCMFSAKTSVPAEDDSFRNLVNKIETFPIFI